MTLIIAEVSCANERGCEKNEWNLRSDGTAVGVIKAYPSMIVNDLEKYLCKT